MKTIYSTFIANQKRSQTLLGVSSHFRRQKPSPGQEGIYASRATIFLGNVVRTPHARARTSYWSMGGLQNKGAAGFWC